MGLIGDLKRWRLVKKGMSSGKKRRVQNDSSLACILDRSTWLRFCLYAFFCAAAGALLLWHYRMPREPMDALMYPMYAVLISVTAMVMVELSHPSVTRRNRYVLLLTGGLLAQLGLTALMRLMTGTLNVEDFSWMLLAPYAVVPIIHTVLLGTSAGALSAVYAALLGTLLARDDNAVLFMCLSLAGGLAGVISLREVRRRAQILRAGFYSGLGILFLACVFQLVNFSDLGTQMSMPQWKLLVLSILSPVGVGILTGLVITGILTVLESLFGITTNISWLEQADLNHPLLRRLQLEAPGTFHHSLLVASLAEAAAEAVGANAILCRVCAYFHDVGKLTKPEYFIENIQDGQENPHDSLTSTMSALIIIAHVKDGVDLALKHHLNPQVIDVIQEHHGDSLVGYFYRQAQQQALETRKKIDKGLENPADLPLVDEKNFRYPGNRPRSRESGIISLADICESASRTLKKPTPAKIRAMVEGLVEGRLSDNQLNECELSLRDLATVKEVFAKTLASILHNRIAYPDEPKKGGTEAKGTETKPVIMDEKTARRLEEAIDE